MTYGALDALTTQAMQLPPATGAPPAAVPSTTMPPIERLQLSDPPHPIVPRLDLAFPEPAGGPGRGRLDPPPTASSTAPAPGAPFHVPPPVVDDFLIERSLLSGPLPAADDIPPLPVLRPMVHRRWTTPSPSRAHSSQAGSPRVQCVAAHRRGPQVPRVRARQGVGSGHAHPGDHRPNDSNAPGDWNAPRNRRGWQQRGAHRVSPPHEGEIRVRYARCVSVAVRPAVARSPAGDAAPAR